MGTLLTAFMLFFIGAHLVGDGQDTLNFSKLGPREILSFVAWLIQLTGLNLAWKWEGIGAGIAILGYIMFSILQNNFWMMPILPLFLITALIYGYCWLRNSNNGGNNASQ